MKRRPFDRATDALRPVIIETGVQRNAHGSVMISAGRTRVLCAAMVEERQPKWMKGRKGGWVTAEYAMLPGAGDTRVRRGPNSRATEIQRLIGRSLRMAVDLKALDGVTITIDCDVIDADGGTRTASITGGWVALSIACQQLVAKGKLKKNPIQRQITAVSVGVVDGIPVLDLDYPEDANADTDMNVVGTPEGGIIEVQGTAEKAPFDRNELNQLLDLAQKGLADLAEHQRRALESATAQ